MATTTTQPPAVEATGEVRRTIERWAGAWEDVGRKARVHDKLRQLGLAEATARAYRAYSDAQQWEAACWHDLTMTVPLRQDTAFRLGPWTIATSPVSRDGLIHVPYRDGLEVRRSGI